MHNAARHRCMIYAGSLQQQLPYIASLLIEELRAGTRCIYMHTPEMVATMRAHLLSSGIDVDAEIDERTLILSSDPTHLIDGKFKVAALLDRLVDAVADAETEGFLKLWISGDMTWEFGDHKDYTDLLAFERGSELLFERFPMLNAVCQYHCGSLPTSAIDDALRSHHSVYIDQTLFNVNPYFTPPNSYGADPIPADINTVIDHFRLHQ